MDNNIIVPQKTEKQDILPEDYNNWRKEIISLIEQSKLKAIFRVNAELNSKIMNIEDFKGYVKTKQAFDTEEILRIMDEMSNEARRVTFHLNTAYLK